MHQHNKGWSVNGTYTLVDFCWNGLIWFFTLETCIDVKSIMIQFVVTVCIRLYAAAYKVIFLSFRAAYNRGWLTMKGGLHFLFLYFMERCRWRYLFLDTFFRPTLFSHSILFSIRWASGTGVRPQTGHPVDTGHRLQSTARLVGAAVLIPAINEALQIVAGCLRPTSGQPSNPSRHPTCWASSQWSHTISRTPCHGAWTSAPLSTHPSIECCCTAPQIKTPICTRRTASDQLLWKQQHTCGAVDGSSMERGRTTPQDSAL